MTDDALDAKSIRKAREVRAERMGGKGDPHEKVDASSWTPDEPLNAEAKTGLRPISKRAFKHGGSVAGEHAHKHAGRKPRAGGGSTTDVLSGIKRYDRTSNPVVAREKANTEGLPKGIISKTTLQHPSQTLGSLADKYGEDRLRRSLEHHGLDTSRLASGGRTGRAGGGKASADAYVNRDGKEANAKFGKPHTGGYAAGGVSDNDGDDQNPVPTRALDMNNRTIGGSGSRVFARGGKAHSDEAEDRALVKKMVKPDARTGKKHGGEAHPRGCSCSTCTAGGTRPTGGREARAKGGRAKGKTNIVIAINPHHPNDMPPAGVGGSQQGAPPMPARPVSVPPAAPAPAMPMGPGVGGSAMGAPSPMAGVPVPGGVPMPRKRGGRTYKDMEAGSGSGLGRLEKADIQMRRG